MKRTALIAFLTPCLMAPTCAEGSGDGGAATQTQLAAVLCTASGTPVAIGYASPGDWIFVCTAAQSEIGCECSTLVNEVEAILSLPPSVPVQQINGIAGACWEAATANPDPSIYNVDRGCAPKGIYSPGPGGPQAIEPDVQGDDDSHST